MCQLKGWLMGRLLLRGSVLVYALVLFLPIIPTFAAPPDSGSILSEQKQQETFSVPSSQRPAIEMESELPADSRIKVNVKKFEFSGDQQIVSFMELDKIVSSYVNQTLDFTQLQNIARKVTKYLREETGCLLGRAYLPQQDVTDGVVRIAIIVGRLDGNVRVSIEEPYRIRRSILENIAARAIRPDEAIRLDDLERAVLLIDDLPAISARAYLDKGQLPETSRITVQASEGRAVSFTATGDNFGNRYTGYFRRGLQMNVSDGFGRGDSMSVAYLNADGIDQGRADFALPVGPYGTYFNASYNGLRYDVGGKLEDLLAKGQAHIFAAGLRHPLKRTKKSSLWLGTGYNFLRMEDKLDETVTSDRDVDVAGVNMSGNFYDGFFGGGLTSLSLALSQGRVRIDDGKANDDSGARTAGNFWKTSYTFARLQRIAKSVSLFASARGQFADGNLDSSQKMILGGPTGVRAYPVGEASGDEGHVFTLEKRLELPARPSGVTTQLVGFFDAGHIRLHKDTWANSVTNISGRNHYWLTGAGVGLNFEHPGKYRVQLSYARKVGKNVGRDTSDNDVDNRSDDGRFWIQSVFWF
jgi:hemolysin activation/secretion protein